MRSRSRAAPRSFAPVTKKFHSERAGAGLPTAREAVAAGGRKRRRVWALAGPSVRLGEKSRKEKERVFIFWILQNLPPRPDGFPAHFFQRHWKLCGTQVTSAVLWISRGDDDPMLINDTILVLIPKVDNPHDLSKFRLISLCNVIYKIASKAVANRLKVILPEIISKEQSAFVPGRMITDNIIIAYECLHFMKKAGQGSKMLCTQVGHAKAYDRVEWPYLRAIMLRLGFPQIWVEMIMKLVTSVSFSVQLNGDCLESFVPTRGIRQDDPTSRYLFLLAEGLRASSNQGINHQPSMALGGHRQL